MSARITAYWDGRARAGYDAQPGQDAAADRWRSVLGPLVRELVGPSADVLDAGCGTGFCARLLAADGHRVIGVDTSEGMLAVARERAPGLRFVVGDAGALDGFGPVDLVVTRNVLWTLPDPAAALRSWAGVLRPGGAVVVSDARWGAGSDANADSPAAVRRFEDAYRGLDLPLGPGLDAAVAGALLVGAGFGEPVEHTGRFGATPYPDAPGFFLLSAPAGGDPGHG